MGNKQVVCLTVMYLLTILCQLKNKSKGVREGEEGEKNEGGEVGF